MNLETQRLFMRPIRAWDAGALHRLQCDPLVVESTMRGIPPTREMSDARLSLYLHEWETYGIGIWIVYEREESGDLRFVGRSGVSRFGSDIQFGCALFGSRSGQRIGPESLKPVFELAFATQPIDRLVSVIRPTNTRSLRMANALGLSCLEPIVFNGTKYQFYEMRRPPQ
ncbi:GNAT family N-acetyltransferase [Mesorhizobium sp. AR02]|uniref:GNAT family N-acetyltransferase n=1 Tax=Mesorhizobium sp. AR02 TaxID=2865837 RepID=UPI0022089889|nr:GNAT family N-acetyltransferase [Mesorhizobium sp. AR02]UVK50477.1 GNAT family N-acetyltransferase [Mesorhizobium sp. AR02]